MLPLLRALNYLFGIWPGRCKQFALNSNPESVLNENLLCCCIRPWEDIRRRNGPAGGNATPKYFPLPDSSCRSQSTEAVSLWNPSSSRVWRSHLEVMSTEKLSQGTFYTSAWQSASEEMVALCWSPRPGLWLPLLWPLGEPEV